MANLINIDTNKVLDMKEINNLVEKVQAKYLNTSLPIII